jgi:hypothetical protein
MPRRDRPGVVYHVVNNHGGPCPGIGDQLLNVMDIQLHFGYNLITYSATVVPFWFVLKARSRDRAARTSSVGR